MVFSSSIAPETIHPSLWRASQLARATGDYVASGHAALSAELPGAGWPAGALTEILIQHRGTAELSLLQPALASLKQGHIIFLQAPYQPQALALAGLGLDLSQLLWIRCGKHADALWTAEQILRSASCAALLFWQSQVKTESLRRLHLAAQSGRTLFFMMRPPDYAQSSSPAPLRLRLTTAATGLQVELIKRRGAQQHAPVLIHLPLLASMYSHGNIQLDHVDPHSITATNNAIFKSLVSRRRAEDSAVARQGEANNDMNNLEMEYQK